MAEGQKNKEKIMELCVWWHWRKEGQKKQKHTKKKENRQRKCLHSCQRARTAEKLSVIKALTASDSDIAPFCSGPITALTGIQNRPGCHVERWQVFVSPFPLELPVIKKKTKKRKKASVHSQQPTCLMWLCCKADLLGRHVPIHIEVFDMHSDLYGCQLLNKVWRTI